MEYKSNGCAFARSFFIPGWGQAYQEKTVQSGLYSMLFICGVSASAFATINYNKAVEKYDHLQDRYKNELNSENIISLNNDIELANEEVQKKEKTRNTMYILTGGIWLWNIIDIFLLPPGYKDVIRLSPTQKSDQPLLNLKLEF